MLGATRGISQRLLMPVASAQRCSVRHKTVWIYTIAPPIRPTNRTMGPFPNTPEELERAARKYNMIPEDYKPFPEDEGYGDYPDLPAVGAFNRDKYDDFEDIWEMRHWGEPFHMHSDLYSWERKDPMDREKITYQHSPYWKKFLVLYGTVGALSSLIFLFMHYNINFNFPWKIRDKNLGRPLYAFPESPNEHHHHHH